MLCRNCNSCLNSEVIDFVGSPPANSLLQPADLDKPEIYYPLKVYVCGNCWLVQIDEFKPAKEIFSSEYVYHSSFSSHWLEHSKRFATQITQTLKLSSKSQVIEIGSNDGYLLQYFHPEISCLGIEPSSGPAAVAMEKGISTRVGYFGTGFAEELITEGYRADLVIANNVLAHVPNLHDFISGLKVILKDDGMISIEFPHLVSLIDNCLFDTIYHEHFSYFSLTTLKSVFNRHELKIVDVEHLTTHGGSLRVCLTHSDCHRFSQSDTVSEFLEIEREKGVTTFGYYQDFSRRVRKIRTDFMRFLLDAEQSSKKVMGYAAAAKGSMLLNYCGIKPDLIFAIGDKSPHKQGRFMPGSHIPILAPGEILSHQPDYVVIFSWNIREEIAKDLSEIRSWDGYFVTALPSLTIF